MQSGADYLEQLGRTEILDTFCSLVSGSFLSIPIFVCNKNNSSMFWFTKSFLATSRLVIVKISIIILSVKESYCKGSWSLDLDRLCLRNNFTVNCNGLRSKTFALMQGERCCVS